MFVGRLFSSRSPTIRCLKLIRGLPVHLQGDLIGLYEDPLACVLSVQIEVDVPLGGRGVRTEGGILDEALTDLSGLPNHLKDPGIVPTSAWLLAGPGVPRRRTRLERSPRRRDPALAPRAVRSKSRRAPPSPKTGPSPWA